MRVHSDRIAECWPKASDIGFSSEMETFGLEFPHGIGLGIHERPIISRLNAFEEPAEIKPGMVFALRPTARPKTTSRQRASRKRWSSPIRVEVSGRGTADHPSLLIGAERDAP